jgi:hypothetical protein
MTIDSLTRARDSKALTHLQRQHAPGGQASARPDGLARLAGAVQATARWAAVSAGVAAVHFAAWRFLFFP